MTEKLEEMLSAGGSELIGADVESPHAFLFQHVRDETLFKQSAHVCMCVLLYMHV